MPLGSKKQKDKADRRRLEFLARLTQQLDQRTDRMGLRLAELDESQGTLAGQVARLGERLERLDERQTEVAGVLSEAMAQAREAKGLAEHPPAVEALREHLASLRNEGERVARLLQGITSGLEGLHQALDEERGRVQSLAGRLEVLDQIQRGLLEREQGLRDALETLRKDPGGLTGGTPEADRLDDLEGRLEAAVTRWGEEAGQWEEAQETLTSGLEVLQARVDRLGPLVQEGGRLLQKLADDLEPLAQGLAEARRGLETQEVFRGEALRRLDALETLSEGLQARIDHLADRHQWDVDGLGARLQELEKRAGVRDQGMLHLAQVIASQGERIGELQMELREQNSGLQDLAQESDRSGSLLEETRQRVEDQGGRLRRLGIGQRILGVTAGVAVLALLAVIAGVSWFEGQRRELEHRSVVRDLDRMERRLARGTAAGPAPPQVLARRPDQSGGKAGGVDPAVTGLEARQRRLEATLEHLRATLARLEKGRRKASPSGHPAAAGKGGRAVGVRPGGPGEAGAPDKTRESPWHLAQQRGAFGIQIMGVRSLDRLHAFMEREGLISRVAWYRSRFQGKPWYVVFVGPYPDAVTARTALKDLPEALRSGKPWVRRLPARPLLNTWSAR